jgi:hypothetical protein
MYPYGQAQSLSLNIPKGFGSNYTADQVAQIINSPTARAASSNTSKITNYYPPAIDTSSFIQNGGSNIQDSLNQIMGSSGNIVNPTYPAGSFDVTPFKDFYDKAYQQLAPYYKQLLEEAKGDLNVALTNLERDYAVGARTKVEDFMNSMETLGVTMPAEDTALQGSLNKRGFALTENPQGQTTYAGGGLAADEVGKLSQNQMLRQQAVQRTRQRGLESEAIKKVVGGQKSQQEFRNVTQSQQAAHETQATNLASQYQSADIAGKQAGIARAEAGAKTGGTGGGNVNPEDVWSIKAAHPGYNSWNDPNSVIADYKVTRGVGK